MLPQTSVMKEELLFALQSHPGCEVTLMVTIPPACATSCAIGETLNTQSAGRTGRPTGRRRVAVVTGPPEGLLGRGDSISVTGSQASDVESDK